MHMRPLLEPLAQAERLSDEDMAARRADEFLADALMVQQLRAAGGGVVELGTCTNCGEHCAPRAVYCDADCRADHERRMAVWARNGRKGAAT